MLSATEIDGGETSAEMIGGTPTDLAAHPGFIARPLNRRKFAQECEQNGFEEIPIFRAAGEEGAKPKDGVSDLIYIYDSEIAGAAGGDIEAETEGAGVWSFVCRVVLKELEKTFVDEVLDVLLA